MGVVRMDALSGTGSRARDRGLAFSSSDGGEGSLLIVFVVSCEVLFDVSAM